ncbi:MAG: cation:proton antiporter [Actinobacteria bacterium]|nr:cation:proton antiporter [Actinomycetota bacterium]
MTLTLLAAAAPEGGGAPAFLTEVAALLIAAAIAAYTATRLRQVPIVGFLVAGVVIGPNAVGLVRSIETVNAAAELGVILLLFTIGIEFSLDRLVAIRRLIIGGGTLQVGLAIAVTAGICVAVGSSVPEAVFSGMLVALSSTAIVLKLLAGRSATDSRPGRVQVGLLIFQDLAIVAFVLLVPMLSGDGGSALDMVVALGRAAVVVAAVLVGARRVMPQLLERVARACSQEVFLLVVVAVCIGTAYISGLLIGSVTLGAFLAGLLVGESAFDLQALGEIIPLQTLFSAVFFISVGMLLDPGFLLANAALVLAVVAVVALIKVTTTAVAVAALREPVTVTAVAAFGLAQVGEFSFVLEGVGREAGLTPAGLGETGSQTFIAATVVLMLVTPALSALGRMLAARAIAGRDRSLAEDLVGGSDTRHGHVVIAGYGAAARALAELLDRNGIPFVVTTLSPDGASEAADAGYDVLRGDATRRATLEAAETPDARCVVIADDEPDAVARTAATARMVAPGVPVIARVWGDADPEALGVDELVTAENASALAVAVRVLRRFGLANTAIAAEVDRIKRSGWTGGAVTATLSAIDRASQLEFRPIDTQGCPHVDEITPVLPSAAGCEDCLRMGARWNHLRVCLSCGHVGCCDSSPNRHATAHHNETGHPLIASGEEGENWAWCYVDRARIDGQPTIDSPT